ncbi:MAG: hypothetical protein PHF26_01375 [Candidatus Gracilibacteria bacterium]|nr:hypothetical protein [Candidatus Gracilibacteria bacterium]
MIKINKPPYFCKTEKKYLSKLSKPQKEDYEKRVKDFEKNEDPVHIKNDTHSLTGDLKGFHSFTCCRSNGRSDRIIFSINSESNIVNFYDIKEVTFHSVGDHDAYKEMKKRI